MAILQRNSVESCNIFSGDGWAPGVRAEQRWRGNRTRVWWRVRVRQWHPALQETGKQKRSISPVRKRRVLLQMHKHCSVWNLMSTFCSLCLCWSQRGRRRSVVLCLEYTLYSRWGGWCCPAEPPPPSPTPSPACLLCISLKMHGLFKTATAFVPYSPTCQQL